jgi:hypothetical protein
MKRQPHSNRNLQERPMNAKSFRNPLLVVLTFVVLGISPARAQAPLEPAQMSPRTIFYLIWRGAPAADARKANSLMALWDDPDFASVRSAMAANMLASSEQKPGQPKLTVEQVQEFASLLENSFTVGYLAEPAKREAAGAASATDSNAAGGTGAAKAKPPAWNGMFFVYDRTGKEAVLAKAILLMRAQAKEMPHISPVTIGDAQVLKIEEKNSTTYWAEHGKYAISASERSVMEDVLGRLDAKTTVAGPLTQLAAYQEAKPIVGSGVIEFFLRIPNLKEFAPDSKAGDLKVGQLLDAAKLDAIHSVCGHVTFEGAKTHVQAAILGDTAPGTPFDIWTNGVAAPASLALVPADAISYGSTQINFLGIYAVIKRIARAAFPTGQQGNADLLDTLAQARIGMPLPDAIGLFSGEIASMQTNPSLDSAKQVYFFGIRKKPETLKLIRTVFSDQLTSERNEGDVTYMKISLGGSQGNAGVAQWNFFNLAVMPDMILGARRVDSLREVVANRGKEAAGGGLASVPQFQAGRAQYPENLNGLGYFDFQKVDWQAMKDRWISEAKKSAAQKSADAAKKNMPATTPTPDWLLQANPQVFARHLHYSSSVSWKDAKGVHWEQWVE